MQNPTRSFVIRAVNQVLDSYEIDDLSYFDALHTSEIKYSANWKQYRESKQMWTPQDEQRSRRFSVPSGEARKVFDTDEEVQRLMASRDPRLPMFRNKLEEILEEMNPTHEDDLLYVLREFISFAASTLKHDPYPWRVTINQINYVFPGKDIYAFWVCLKNLCNFTSSITTSGS